MNSVILIGNLTADPELRTTKGGTPYCAFTLAVQRERPAEAGERPQADFIRIMAWGKQAENCAKYLAKGNRAAVQGQWHTGEYTDKDGAKRYSNDCIADRVQFLTPKKQEEPGGW